MGRRTVSHILWSVERLIDGDPSSYHRFFSAARWLMWTMGRILAGAVLELTAQDRPVLLDIDDTVAEHRGKRVFGRGCIQQCLPFATSW